MKCRKCICGWSQDTVPLLILGDVPSRQFGPGFPEVGSRRQSHVLRDWRVGMEVSGHWTRQPTTIQGRQQSHGMSK